MSQTFEQKVESLVNKLGEDIAGFSKTDQELQDGFVIAALLLLDSMNDLEDILTGNDNWDEDDEDDFLLDFNDEDEFDLDEELDDFFGVLGQADGDEDHGP